MIVIAAETSAALGLPIDQFPCKPQSAAWQLGERVSLRWPLYRRDIRIQGDRGQLRLLNAVSRSGHPGEHDAPNISYTPSTRLPLIIAFGDGRVSPISDDVKVHISLWFGLQLSMAAFGNGPKLFRRVALHDRRQ